MDGEENKKKVGMKWKGVMGDYQRGNGEKEGHYLV